jgi:glutathione S-transferase
MRQGSGFQGLETGSTPSESLGFDRLNADLTPMKVRRSVPPELAYAVSLERLYWALHIKGLNADAVTVMPRAQRLAVRFGKALAPAKDISLKAALSQLETLRPEPSLVPADADVRQRAGAFERWMTGEVADTVMWCLLRPPVKNAAQHVAAHAAAKHAPQSINAEMALSDQFMTSVLIRALDVVQSLSAQQPYLFGSALTQADLTAAAVLAPVVRKQGWTWAGRLWTPLSAVAGRSALARHPGANWVRMMYDLHSPNFTAQPEQTRAWVP